MTNRNPPAGWYDDPAEPGRQRYWDGGAWTTETRDGTADLPPPHISGAGPAKINGFAVASLVLGILWVWFIGSLLAVIFGHIALGQIKRAADAERGRGLAIAGLVLGYLGIGLLVLGIIAFLIAVESGGLELLGW